MKGNAKVKVEVNWKQFDFGIWQYKYNQSQVLATCIQFGIFNFYILPVTE